MAITITIDETDDPNFQLLVESVIKGLDDTFNPDEFWVIRIRGWFDHKWLNFSGNGRVRFDSPLKDHPQVGLQEHFQDKLTFPPFTPRRVLKQSRWTYEDSVKAKGYVP